MAYASNGLVFTCLVAVLASGFVLPVPMAGAQEVPATTPDPPPSPDTGADTGADTDTDTDTYTYTGTDTGAGTCADTGADAGTGAGADTATVLRRGPREGDAGVRRRRKCQLARQQPAPVGARAEARLAWSKLASASDHICKPSRSAHSRVAFPRAPFLKQKSRSTNAPAFLV